MRIKNSTYRKAAAVLAAAVAATIFTLYETAPGSGTAAPSAQVQAQPPAQAQAADPVTVLLQMHVPVLPGVTVGQVDIDGDWYASGQFASGEQVTVNTYASRAAEDADIARNPSNDVNKLLVGKLFTVTVTGVDDGTGISFPTPVATLAQESGAVAE